jgi:LysR family transcriptional regulator, glycine cleavage system transcriptional activator
MRRLPPLMSLRAFEAAARHLSFKAAAAELGVTPTAISHQIRLLEDTCGRPLFLRRPRPLRLTSVGERLFPVLRDCLDAFAAAIASIAEGPEQSPLRVTCPNAFAGRWLIPRLPLWRESHPEVPLEVIGTDAVLDLRSGDADVAIRYARSMSTDLTAREIFRDAFFPMCSPELLGAGAYPIKRAADLLRYPLIHYHWFNSDPRAPTWRQWLATARSVDPDLPNVTKSWDLSFREELHAMDAVVAGQGIAICSDVVVRYELESGRLVKAHNLSLPGYGYYLVHMPHHPRLTTITAFSSWMRSVT